VSLNTFIFSLFGMGFALANGVIDIPRALFYMSFISIQLVEYFAWKNLSDTTLPSKVGLLLITLQIPLMINTFYKGPHKALLYALFGIFAVTALSVTRIKFSMHKAPNGHLTWDWLNGFPKVFFLIFILFYLGIGLSDFNPFTYLPMVAIISFSWYMYSASGTFGSMWCWLANIIALSWIFRVFKKELC
jgi:hypothetical protein